MRVAVINLIQTPYREPLYESLSRTPGLTFRFFYLQTKDSVRGWSKLACCYDAVQVRCLTPEPLYPIPVIGAVNPGLIRHLRRFSPDCLVVYGYSYWTQMQVIAWAIRRRTPYLLWADSNSHKLTSSGPMAALKEACLRYFCRYAAGALTIGSLNEEFWRHYGLDGQRQFRSPLAVDNDYFGAQAAIWRRDKAAHRQSLGLPPGRLLLFVGRFAPSKNLEVLLRALAVCRKAGNHSLSLALVGDGPEKTSLSRLTGELGLSGVLQFGFQPQSELPKFYGIADALVLPSMAEPWGLVVNEAMASGLPVLLSRSTGCLPDLLEERGNGWSFDEKDVGSVAGCLQRFGLLREDELARMGARSAQLISRWSYANALAGIHRALESVAAGVHRSLSAVSSIS